MKALITIVVDDREFKPGEEVEGIDKGVAERLLQKKYVSDEKGEKKKKEIPEEPVKGDVPTEPEEAYPVETTQAELGEVDSEGRFALSDDTLFGMLGDTKKMPKTREALIKTLVSQGKIRIVQ